MSTAKALSILLSAFIAWFMVFISVGAAITHFLPWPGDIFVAMQWVLVMAAALVWVLLKLEE